MSILFLLLVLALWGVVHSALASYYAKDKLRIALGMRFMRIYRLFYNVFALISFLPILYLMKTLPDRLAYEIPSPWSLIMYTGQGIAIILLVTALLQTDLLSFAGVRQLFEDEKSGALVTRGLYRVVRHPLYTFSLLFIWLTTTVSLNTLTVYLGSTFYVLVGIYFEERKLLREFGESYASYRINTPMLIPGIGVRK